MTRQERPGRLTASQRADWLVRDPDEYFAFVREEAEEVAASMTAERHEWRKIRAKADARIRRDNRWYIRLWRKYTR